MKHVVIALTVSVWISSASYAAPPRRVRPATPPSVAAVQLKGLAFDAPMAKLRPLAATMHRVVVANPVQLPTAAETGGTDPGAGTPPPPAATPDPTALYQAGVTLSPHCTQHGATGSYAVLNALVVLPAFSTYTKQSSTSNTAGCQAGRFNATPSSMYPYASYVFRHLPAGTHTYMVTFTASLPTSFVRVKVGNTFVPPGALLTDGNVHRALVAITPSTAPSSPASISLYVQGPVTVFQSGAIKLQLVD